VFSSASALAVFAKEHYSIEEMVNSVRVNPAGDSLTCIDEAGEGEIQCE
jgi:hypothetical protein